MWDKIYLTINNTLGKRGFKPLNALIKEEIQNAIYGFSLVLKNAFIESGSDINSIVAIPNGSNTTGDYSNNLHIKTVVMPNSVEEIPAAAFGGCGNLNNVFLSQNLKVIGAGAFFDTGITQIDIPTTVEEIHLDAFSDTSSLKAVRFHGKPKTIAPCFGGSAVTDIFVPWHEGGVAGAPWGAENATIHYGE